MLVKKLLLVMLINIVDDLEAQMWNILRSSKMSGLFVVVLRVQQSLRLHRTSGPRSFVLRQAFAWNPHSLGISPQEAHLD